MSCVPPRSRRHFASLLAVPLLLVVLQRAPVVAATEAPPNIVVVLCDDLGYGDLACYGNDELQTPHVDRFAAEGLKLTSCYAAHPNCSPSRTGMMTGGRRTAWACTTGFRFSRRCMCGSRRLRWRRC